MFDTLSFLSNPIPSNILAGIPIYCANTPGGARFFFGLLLLKVVKIIDRWGARNCQMPQWGWMLPFCMRRSGGWLAVGGIESIAHQVPGSIYICPDSYNVYSDWQRAWSHETTIAWRSVTVKPKSLWWTTMLHMDVDASATNPELKSGYLFFSWTNNGHDFTVKLTSDLSIHGNGLNVCSPIYSHLHLTHTNFLSEWAG